MELSNSDCQTISIARGVPVDDVSVIGWCSRSLWKPEHSFEGLRYRVGKHVIFADPDKGDTVAVLESLFSVRIDNVSVLFCKGKHFKYHGEADTGHKQVCPTDNTVIFEASLLSRKVMLFAGMTVMMSRRTIWGMVSALFSWTTCAACFLLLKGQLLFLTIL